MPKRSHLFYHCWSLVLAGLVGLPGMPVGEPVLGAEPSDGPVFMAGAAASNITPALGGEIVGSWQPYPSTHIHDELHARCLVLDDGKTRLAIVVCDSLGMPRELFDEARRRTEEVTGIPAACILTAATHTHSAVSAKNANRYLPGQPLGEYQQFIVGRIVDGIVRAVNNLEPAEIGWASIDEPALVFNRRWFMKPGTPTPNPFGGNDQVVFNPGRNNPNVLKPAGPTDPQITFLSVRSPDGRPIALLANYSLHYVGGTKRGDVSADYFAMFADRIQELLEADRLERPFVGIMTNGASGDINNINVLGRPEPKERYEQMRYVAHRVADKVLLAEREIDYRTWVPLAAASTDLTLTTRLPTAEQLARAERVAADPQSVTLFHNREPIYAERFLAMRELPAQLDIPLTALRIGELGVVAIPFEVFAEIGLEIRQRSPAATTFTISHAGGTFGYLPTERQHEFGGYETWLGSNWVQKDAAAKITDTLTRLLTDAKPQPPVEKGKLP